MNETDLETKGSSEAAMEKRRRLLKASIGGGAVLMTITSRSALACTKYTCALGATTPSAFGSMNVSPGHEQPSGCLGRSPGYWKNHPEEWPRGYRAHQKTWGSTTYPATKFGEKFSGFRGFDFSGKTLLQVLSPEGYSSSGIPGGPEADLARALVAGLLNAAKGLTSSVLSVSKVQGVWAEYVSKGYYEPVAGIKWYIGSTEPPTSDSDYNGGIVGYLQSTYA